MRSSYKLQGLARGQAIARSVAWEWGFSLAELQQLSRRRTAVRARDAVVLALRKQTGLSLNEIAEILGWADHASVMNSLQRSAQALQREEKLNEKHTDRS